MSGNPPSKDFVVELLASDLNASGGIFCPSPKAGMTLSIGWPYGSNLHCEILVDDQIVAQADQFIAPRFFRVKDDPLYGTLQCGAPLDIPVAGIPDPVDAPTDPNAVPADPNAPAPAA